MTKPEDFYMGEDIKRTLEEIRQCCLKLEYSCERPLLLNIPQENIVLDELHLMLRITGIRLKNLPFFRAPFFNLLTPLYLFEQIS